MSTNLEELLKTSAQMKKFTDATGLWKDIFDKVSGNTMKSRIPMYGLSGILGDIGKSTAFEHKNSLQSFLKTLPPQNSWIDKSAAWQSLFSIADNHQAITSSLSKTLGMLPEYQARQVKPPVFLQDILGIPTVNYNRKISSLTSVLSGLGSQIAMKSFTGIDPNVLESFSATTKEAAAITTEITEKEFATRGDIERLESFIGSSLEEFGEAVNEGIKKQASSPLAIISLWVTLISIILTIYTMVQAGHTATPDYQLVPNSQYATRPQVEELKKIVEEKLEKRLKAATREARIRRGCNLRVKPRSNSSVLLHLQARETIYVIDTWHKWAHITIIDPSDHLPVSGWVLKKNVEKLGDS